MRLFWLIVSLLYLGIAVAVWFGYEPSTFFISVTCITVSITFFTDYLKSRGRQ